jgi:RNA polymerase sigma factor (sigma-70 family)
MFEEIENHLDKQKKSAHPSVEQTMIRMALESLTDKQRQIWDMHNYEKLTQDEIARKLGIKQQSVEQQLGSIEKKVTKWCKLNRGAYLLLKIEQQIMDGD